MAMSNMTDDKIESNYKGSALLRLLSYMKPYIGQTQENLADVRLTLTC